jgi:hypothetical protein
MTAASASATSLLYRATSATSAQFKGRKPGLGPRRLQRGLFLVQFGVPQIAIADADVGRQADQRIAFCDAGADLDQNLRNRAADEGSHRSGLTRHEPPEGRDGLAQRLHDDGIDVDTRRFALCPHGPGCREHGHRDQSCEINRPLTRQAHACFLSTNEPVILSLTGRPRYDLRVIIEVSSMS